VSERVDITVCEVGARDGLQNFPKTLPPATRAELVNRLARTGLRVIEAASFVRDDWVPQMAGAEEVVAALDRQPGVEYTGLVLNVRGWERLRETPLDRVGCGIAVTETFNRRNANMSLEQAIARAHDVVAAADRPIAVGLSVAFGCPFEGRVDPGAVAEVAAQFDGVDVVLADTIGVATPKHVRSLVERTGAVGFHGHNTRNTGYANALAALEGGARHLDASVGGLGGCPFAPRATGNIATEDLVYLLKGEGIDTGVDLDELIRVAEWLEGVLGQRLEGYLYRAGNWPTDGSTDAASATAPEAASSSIASSE
jgi:isopropylmalate/homocitrate/citramalate synthase